MILHLCRGIVWWAGVLGDKIAKMYLSLTNDGSVNWIINVNDDIAVAL